MAESLTLTKKYRAIADLCEYLESLQLTGGWSIVVYENAQIYEVHQKLHSLLSCDSDYNQRLQRFLDSANSFMDLVKPGIETINPLQEPMNWELLSRTLAERPGVEHLYDSSECPTGSLVSLDSEGVHKRHLKLVRSC